jgi:histidyl-tRNA synthetase
MMLADTLEALGLGGDYVIKINSRKLLDGVLEAAGVGLDDPVRRGIVLRAIDKLDRLGLDGLAKLLGPGRKDESGDFTKGANLPATAIDAVLKFFAANDPESGRVGPRSNTQILAELQSFVGTSAIGAAGIADLVALNELIAANGYADGRIAIDPSIVRGLDYYTGAVFEAQLTFPVANEAGETVVFGSVAGGGRYDDLVARFTGQAMPATGVSIGVSRLLTALKGRASAQIAPLVVVLAMDKAGLAESFALVRELRAAGIRAEAYVGDAGLKAQFKYADKRGAAIAVVEGSDERARGEITLKDLALGAELAKSVESRAAWVEGRPAQIAVPRGELLARVNAMLAREG